MALVRRYSIYCNAEAAWKFVWSATAPTKCPTNAGHSVKLASVMVSAPNIGSTSRKFIVQSGIAIEKYAAASLVTAGTISRYYGAPDAHQSLVAPCQFVDASNMAANIVLSWAQTDRITRYFAAGADPSNFFQLVNASTTDSYMMGYEMVRGVSATEFVRIRPYRNVNSGEWLPTAYMYTYSGGTFTFNANSVMADTVSTPAYLADPLYDAAVLGTAALAIIYPTTTGCTLASIRFTGNPVVPLSFDGNVAITALPNIATWRGLSVAALDTSRVMAFGNLTANAGLAVQIFQLSAGADPLPGTATMLDNMNVILAAGVASCFMLTDIAIVAYTATNTVVSNGYVAAVRANTLVSGDLNVYQYGDIVRFSAESARVTMPRIASVSTTEAIVAYTDDACPACGFVTGLTLGGSGGVTLTVTSTRIFSYNVGSPISLAMTPGLFWCFYMVGTNGCAGVVYGQYSAGTFTFPNDTKPLAPFGMNTGATVVGGICEIATCGQIGGFNDLLVGEPCYVHTGTSLINSDPAYLSSTDFPYPVGIALSDSVIDIRM